VKTTSRSEVGRDVERREVEVAALVEHLGRHVALFEEEELQLGPEVPVVEAQLVRARQRAAHDPARVALVPDRRQA
jgi:hypothetical protein